MFSFRKEITGRNQKTSVIESFPGKFPLVEVFRPENIYWEYFCWYTCSVNSLFIDFYFILRFFNTYTVFFMISYRTHERPGYYAQRMRCVHGTHFSCSSSFEELDVSTRLDTFQSCFLLPLLPYYRKDQLPLSADEWVFTQLSRPIFRAQLVGAL